VGVLLAGCDGGEPCARDSDCTLPALCGRDGQCRRPAPVATGSPCRHNEHCTSNRCLDLGTGAVCVAPCDSLDDCSDDQICSARSGTGQPPEPAGPARLWLVCGKAGAGTRYLGEACAGDSECRGELCDQGRCAAPCKDSCRGPLSCQPGTIARPAASLTLAHSICRAQGPTRVVELGAAPTTAAGSAELGLDLKADDAAGGFILFADDKQDRIVGIRRLAAPGGAKLIDLDNTAGALMRGSSYFGTGTALVPGTDNAAAAPEAGRYAVVIGTYDPKSPSPLVPVDGSVDRVAAVFRRHPGRGGLLDLNIYLAPGTGLKAADAATSAYASEALAQLDLSLRSLLGVAVGEVRYADLTAAEDEVPDGARARTLCSAYSDAGPNGVSVNLLWVKSVAFAAGFSGGIPGPPGLAHRPFSCIVLQRQATSSVMGLLMAHELGHYLGLWHTTEPGGLVGDPISDTPQCAPGTAKTDCPDHTNLMFPYFSTTEALLLTPGQLGVVRASPWLYEVVYPDVCGRGVEGVDVSAHGFASGTTVPPGTSASTLAGSCGGATMGDRVHLLRLAAAAKALDAEVRGFGFEPVLYVRRDRCTDQAAEAKCVAGTGGIAKLKLDNPQSGAYFVIVDGKDGAGRYDLSVRVTK
jgi:hypothetical protein